MRTSLDKHAYGRLVIPLALVLLAFVLITETAQARDLRASVKGTVLDATTMKGVAGVRVYVMEKVYPWGPGTPGADHDWEALATGVTGKNGSYTIQLPRAGTFRVFFVPPDRTRWAMEAYPDAPIPEWGDPVIVEYGATKKGISVKLDPPNRIEGHIWDARSRWDAGGNELDSRLWAPLANLHVAAAFQGLVRINLFVQYPNEPISDDYTDENGFYSLSGLKTYPFFAWVFDEDGLSPQFTDLIVSDGNSHFPNGVKTLDAFVQPVGFANITGRLVDSDGNGVPHRWIDVYVSDNSPDLQRPFSNDADHRVITDDEGYFACTDLFEPAALLAFDGDEEFMAEFYDDADYQSAPEIRVSWGWCNNIGNWEIARHQSGEE